jgi:hypothetical protein
MLRHGRGHVGGPIILRWRQTDDRPDGRTAEADALDQVIRDRLPDWLRVQLTTATRRARARAIAGAGRTEHALALAVTDRVWTVRTALLSRIRCDERGAPVGMGDHAAADDRWGSTSCVRGPWQLRW